VHDAAFDLVISIFAPKNFAETARVLAPGGWLAVVYPGPNHLAELGRWYALMRHHEHKARRSAEAAGRMIGPSTTVQLVRRTLLDPATVRDAVLMGPMPANIAPSMLDAETAPITVTFDIDVLFACKRRTAPAQNRTHGRKGEPPVTAF
jgi:23S rRNA (guanine745-N1)-methyltransferase